MSTHSITLFKTAEMDGTPEQVLCLWRRFDGYPSVHLSELQTALTTASPPRKFVNLLELLADLLPGLVAQCERTTLGQYVPAHDSNSNLCPCYIYELWLEYEPKWNPRSAVSNGIPYVAVHLPKTFGENVPGKCFYRGPLCEADPEAIDKEITAFQEAEVG